LQLLESLGNQPSLTAAAASVGTSQPRATNMLQEIESAFGCRLLDRSPRGVRLNVEGRLVTERLRIALGALDAAQQTLRGVRARALVRVGVLPLVGSDRLSRLVARLQADEAMPRLVLRVATVGELLAMVLAGEVDCAICGLDAGGLEPDASARLHAVNLWEERNLIVAARDNQLTRKRRVSLAELLHHPWLMMPPRSANRQALERMFLRAGLTPPEPTVETETPQMAITYVAGSQMLALVPQTAAAQAEGRVRPIRMEAELAPSWINLVTLRDVPCLPFVEAMAVSLRDP
jgi:DNA-binding transcriptional LysR family regulator